MHLTDLFHDSSGHPTRSRIITISLHIRMAITTVVVQAGTAGTGRDSWGVFFLHEKNIHGLGIIELRSIWARAVLAL
ncbi:hypothetical protein [Desulfotruncus alcoholivorax]|uniref:hypothetical protein n=1 Tax=Desulfotruncus alcoholivorax TaxID=265477 RepID=UPI0003FC2CDF|nr:hypothetical protein [Desulfotruncus alcoholivorax]